MADRDVLNAAPDPGAPDPGAVGRPDRPREPPPLGSVIAVLAGLGCVWVAFVLAVVIPGVQQVVFPMLRPMPGPVMCPPPPTSGPVAPAPVEPTLPSPGNARGGSAQKWPVLIFIYTGGKIDV